jgi:hypothetical protein
MPHHQQYGFAATFLALSLSAVFLSCSSLPGSLLDGAPVADASPTVDGPQQDSPPIEADSAPYCTSPLADMGPGSDGCPVGLPATEDLIDQALAKIQRDRCQVVFGSNDLDTFPTELTNDPYRLPFLDRIHRSAFNVGPFADTLAHELDQAQTTSRPATSSLMVATHYMGHGGRVCEANARQISATPLVDAISRLVANHGATPESHVIAEALKSIPAQMRITLAQLIDAIDAAATERNAAFARATLPNGIDLQTLFTYAISLDLPTVDGKAFSAEQTWVQSLLQGNTSGPDYTRLYHAAIALTAAVEDAQLSRFAGLQIDAQFETPLGWIILKGPADHTHAPLQDNTTMPIMLLIDTGGNDTYHVAAGANVSAQNPVSLLIDLDGTDTYGYIKVPHSNDGTRLASDADGRAPEGYSLSMRARQGAGRLGFGFLFDLGLSNDAYSSLRMSQGFGSFGVGLLYDAGGNDQYEAEAAAQGAGVHGIGLLLDSEGNDTYKTYVRAQGYAYVRGVGVLYDKQGNDAYLADLGNPDLGGDPLYPAPQQPERSNASFAQGAGYGRRADTTDGIYMSGGLGVLRDAKGEDRYQASVFAQGTGYWFGTGVLADGGGNDTYDGIYYVQGSAAHFAVAALVDDSGDDNYNQTILPIGTSVGVGHDFSVGLLWDRSGHDMYRAPNLSLGSGNDNGIGLFVDVQGDDHYQSVGLRTLGGASLTGNGPQTKRAEMLTLGLFVDASGTDSYFIDGLEMDFNSTTWLYASTNSVPNVELGVGVDGEASADLVPTPTN